MDCNPERGGPRPLPPSYMDVRVGRLKQTLKRDGIDLDAPCTSGQGNHCWILLNLTPWNKVLHPASMELKEYEPGKLALNANDLEVRACFDDGFLLDASYIAYWLVQVHRCVQFFKPHPLIVAPSSSVLKAALASNAGLRHFEFRGNSKWQHEERYFAEGIATLTRLESLKLRNVTFRQSSAALIARMLERNGNLKAITFSENSLSLHSSETLLRALRNSTTLTELAFDNNSIGRRGIRYLSRLVSRSQSLKKLSLKWSIKAEPDVNKSLTQALRVNNTLEEMDLYGCDGYIGGIAEALEVNTALKVVTLTRCDIGDSDTARLATMLKKNGTLRELDLSHNNIEDAGAEALAEGLRANVTLEKLCLSENNITLRGARQLISALATNVSLRLLDFGPTSFWQNEHLLINAALRQARAFGRVRMEWEDADLPELVAALVTDDKLEEVHLTCTENMSENNLHELFSAVASSRSVKKLTLGGSHNEVPVLKHLSKAIEASKSIEYLNLDYQVHEYVDIKEFIEALKHNESVVCCDICFGRYNTRIAKALASLLRENTTIASLVIHYYPSYGKPLEVLSKALCENRTLTRLKIGSEQGSNRVTFRIGEGLRRNLSLLNKAANFVLRPFKDKDTVQTFEKHAESKNLLRHLVHLTKKDEEEVKELIRAAKDYVTENYFVIAGVVKGTVECRPVFPYKTQIDQLNEECWRQVFSYLKICDVILV